VLVRFGKFLVQWEWKENQVPVPSPVSTQTMATLKSLYYHMEFDRIYTTIYTGWTNSSAALNH